MPKLPLRVWKPQENSIKNRLLNSEIPILFGSPGLTYKNDNTYINIDILNNNLSQSLLLTPCNFVVSIKAFL